MKRYNSFLESKEDEENYWLSFWDKFTDELEDLDFGDYTDHDEGQFSYAVKLPIENIKYMLKYMSLLTVSPFSAEDVDSMSEKELLDKFWKEIKDDQVRDLGHKVLNEIDSPKIRKVFPEYFYNKNKELFVITFNF